jgi:hypothetical protein
LQPQRSMSPAWLGCEVAPNTVKRHFIQFRKGNYALFAFK